MCFVCHHIKNSFHAWYKSQVTYTNLTFWGFLLRTPVSFAAQWATECPCCLCISVSTAYPHSNWLAKLPIIVAKKTIVSQVANRSCREEEFQRFPRCYSLEFMTLDQQIILSNSADSSWSVCGHFLDYYALPHTNPRVAYMAIWRKSKSLLSCPVLYILHTSLCSPLWTGTPFLSAMRPKYNHCMLLYSSSWSG